MEQINVLKQSDSLTTEGFSPKALRIAFVSEGNPRDRRTWSGTPFGVFSSLENLGCTVQWISPKGFSLKVFLFFVKSIGWLARTIFRLNIVVSRWGCVSKILARRFRIRDAHFDFVLSIGLTSCAFYRTNLPIIAVIDATFDNFDGYYEKKAPLFFSKLADWTEQKSAQRANKIIVASDWAKRSLIEHYRISENKILVWQLGANISAVKLPVTKIFPKVNEELKLLFVGFDTRRKGLSIAIKATKLLKLEYGRDVVLEVIGTDGDEISAPPCSVRFFGRLNKNNPEEMSKFENLVKGAHVFILPTKAECAGMVFSEAAAYGLPVFSYNTGGVGSYVEHNGNGILLPLSAGEEDFASEIVRCWDEGLFPRFSERGKELFREKLNWTCWLSRFSNLLEDAHSFIKAR